MRSRLVILGTLLVVVSVLAITFSMYSLVRTAAAHISVQVPVVDVDGIGVASVLLVDVQNIGTSQMEPSFWVVWSVYVRNWAVESGPRILAAGASAMYTIRAPSPEAAVPNGTLYIVKILDRVSGVYFRSETSRLDVVGSPPIRNAQFQFWSRSSQNGRFQPFGWSMDAGIGPGDAASASPASGSGGVRLALFQNGEGGGLTWVHLLQDLGTRDIARLRNASLSLCWTVAFEFVRDPASGFPMAASGVELSAGGRLAWFVVSSSFQGVVDLPTQRIFVVRAAIDRPACAVVPVSEMQAYLGAQASNSMTLLVLAAAGPAVAGNFVFVVSALSLQ